MQEDIMKIFNFKINKRRMSFLLVFIMLLQIFAPTIGYAKNTNNMDEEIEENVILSDISETDSEIDKEDNLPINSKENEEEETKDETKDEIKEKIATEEKKIKKIKKKTYIITKVKK